MHYHIVSNTPSYIPESDPYRVETLDGARSAVAQDVEYWTADDYAPDWPEPLCDMYCDRVCLVKHDLYDVSISDDGLYADIHDRTKIYDLGRVIYASECDDSTCEVDDE